MFSYCISVKVLIIVTDVCQSLVLLTWMRHLASTSCSLVWASSSSKCLSCSFSPSFSSSSGSVDVLSLLGDNACRDPRGLNRSRQWSQPITLLCMSTQTHCRSPLVEGGGSYILYTSEYGHKPNDERKRNHLFSVSYVHQHYLWWNLFLGYISPTYCVTLALKCISLSSCIIFQYNIPFQCNVLLQHIILKNQNVLIFIQAQSLSPPHPQRATPHVWKGLNDSCRICAI